jgi:hypothetical protein
MDLKDELRLYVPQLPLHLSPVPIMKMEVETPAVMLKDVWGVTYYIHPATGTQWMMEGVAPTDVTVMRPVSRNPGEAVALVEKIMGFRAVSGDAPYDLRAMEVAEPSFDEARSQAWGTGPIGRSRTAFPMINYDEVVDWETYYMLHPELGQVYEWRSQ